MKIINKPLTGRAFWLKMMDWAIEGKQAAEAKITEANALGIIGQEYYKQGDMKTCEIVRQKHHDAITWASRFKGESYGYENAARVYASWHNVL